MLSIWSSLSSSLLNGERAVVILVLTRIIYCSPFAVLGIEAISLSLLAIAALLVEIEIENSNFSIKCRTRPGASSGILLGAVTLPALLFSKLIQLSRGVALGQVAATDFECVKLIFWAAHISCFCVLLFFSSYIQRLHSSNLVVKFGSMSIVFCVLSYTVLQVGGSNSVVLFWILGHGIAAIKLIQHVFCSFPGCASIGMCLAWFCLLLFPHL